MGKSIKQVLLGLLLLFGVLLILSGTPVTAKNDEGALKYLAEISSNSKDSLKMRAIIELVSWYLNNPENAGSRTAASANLRLANDLAKTKAQKTTLFRILDNEGTRLRNLSRYPPSLFLHEEALRIAKTLNKAMFIARTYNNLGTTYRRMDEFSLAMNAHFNGLKISDSINNPHSSAIALNGIGNIYLSLGNLEMAEQTFMRSLRLERSVNQVLGIAINLNNLGNVARERKQYDKAIDFFDSSFMVNSSINSMVGMGINYHDIAMTYIELNQFELARDYLLKSLGMFKKIGDERYELDAYLNLASCAAETGDTKEKTFYYNMALNLSKKLGVNSAIYKSSIEVAKIHQADGEYQKANELLFEALNYNDSLNITKSSKELSALQFKFEAEKKLRQLEQAKNVISKNNLAMKQQKWRFIFVSGFIGLLVIVISIAYIIKRRYAKNVIGKNVELMRIQKDLAQHTQELEVARKFAEQASAAKAMFLANMSHEIRTPLNTILGSAELLKSSCSDTGNLRHLEAIIISGRGLLKTINAILELSKYESGKEPIALAPIDIIDLCNELEIQFTPLFQKKNIDFSIQFNSPRSLSLIISDEVKIRQILLNLIGNALKFTVEGSVIVKSQVIIFTSQNGFKEEYLVISVEDTGRGISEDKHRSIFESFVQVEQSSLEKTEGTGLGLAIAKRCANLLNGDISLNSIIGKGSTFTVKIPVTISGQLPVDNDDVQITLSKIQSLNEAKPITVIVVDDVLDNRKLIAHFLVETGMRVLEAESARETLRILDSVTPDLILLDLRMPQISGFELNKMLKANPNWAKIPVIAVSASMAEEDKSMVTNANFDMKLQKPFTHKELIDSVYNILIRTT